MEDDVLYIKLSCSCEERGPLQKIRARQRAHAARGISLTANKAPSLSMRAARELRSYERSDVSSLSRVHPEYAGGGAAMSFYIQSAQRCNRSLQHLLHSRRSSCSPPR